MPPKLPPDDDRRWDVVRKHDIPVPVFKAILRVLARKYRERLLKRAKELQEVHPPENDNRDGTDG